MTVTPNPIAYVEALKRERDALRAEMEKVYGALGNRAAVYRPGATAVDVLIAERDALAAQVAMAEKSARWTMSRELELEAMVAVLRETVEVASAWLIADGLDPAAYDGGPDEDPRTGLYTQFQSALTQTAEAAKAFESRARREALEEAVRAIDAAFEADEDVAPQDAIRALASKPETE